MERTLVDFVKALRTAEIKVSPAETLDAMHAMDIVGYEDRRFLKDTLSIVLSKNPEEKEAFDTCFDRFFTFDKFSEGESEESDDWGDGDASDDGEFAPSSARSGEGGRGSGQGMGGGAGGDVEESEAGESSLTPQSERGQMRMRGNKTESMIAIAEA